MQIRIILQAISKGGMNLTDLADKLNMQESAVKGILETLTKKGYLRKESNCSKDKTMCVHCPAAKTPNRTIITYCVTAKGLKYLKKTNDQV